MIAYLTIVGTALCGFAGLHWWVMGLSVLMLTALSVQDARIHSYDNIAFVTPIHWGAIATEQLPFHVATSGVAYVAGLASGVAVG